MNQASSLTPETRLVTHVTSNDLFKTLDESTLRDLEVELELIHLPAEEILFQQGSPGDSMCVLIRGRLGVRIKHPDGSQTVVGELDPGASAGGMALLTGQARAATVYALDDAELVKLSKAGFDRLADKHPQVITEFARTIIPRMRGAQLAGVLTGLFGEMDAATLRDLPAKLEWLHLSSGETLFRRGERGDAMMGFIGNGSRGTWRIWSFSCRLKSMGRWSLSLTKRSLRLGIARPSRPLRRGSATKRRRDVQFA